MALGDLALDHHAVIDREDAGLLVVARTFRRGIRKQEFDIRIFIKVRAAAINEVGRIQDVVNRRLDLARLHHRADIFFRRHLVDGDTGRRCKTDGATMAVRGLALHPEFDVAGLHPPFVFERAAAPQGRRLLVLRHTDPFSLEILGALDAGVLPHQDAGVEETLGREYRQAHKTIIALGNRHDERGKGHFGNIELGELQLPPEKFRGQHHAGQQVNSLGFHASVENGPAAGIRRHGDAELQVHFVAPDDSQTLMNVSNKGASPLAYPQIRGKNNAFR